MTDQEFAMGSEEFAVDFSEAVEFSLWDAGWYPVVIDTAEVVTKDDGTKQISARMKAEDGPYAGQSVFANWQCSGRGSGILKQVLKAVMGEVPESGASLSTADLVGAQIDVFVRPRIWKVEKGGDGETRNNVTRYRAREEVSF